MKVAIALSTGKAIEIKGGNYIRAEGADISEDADAWQSIWKRGKTGNITQAIKMKDKVQPLESLSKKPEEPKIVVNLRRIKRKIMVMSGKGGVGKSTVRNNFV